jgi:hypothetical protein
MRDWKTALVHWMHWWLRYEYLYIKYNKQINTTTTATTTTTTNNNNNNIAVA